MLIRVLKGLFGGKPPVRPAPSSAPAERKPAADPKAEVLARLAAYERGGQGAVAGGHLDDPRARQAQEVPNEALEAILARARTLVAPEPSVATAQRLAAFRERIEARVPPVAGPAVFAFHADLPADAAIDYVDARLNVRDFDYLGILRRFVRHAREHCPGVRVILATSEGSRYAALAEGSRHTALAEGSRGAALAQEGVAVVELPLDTGRPMFERAVAVSAYLGSGAFRGDTAFLDSDAFVNRPLAEVFALGFDLAFTYRPFANLMPVNEGAFFARPRRAAAVARFMRARLATYERIADDPAVQAYYGDVRRWRGGQLSLNAVCAAWRPYSPFRVVREDELALRFLPCDTFNFALGDGESLSASARLDQRYVMHYKGPRKYALAGA